MLRPNIQRNKRHVKQGQVGWLTFLGDDELKNLAKPHSSHPNFEDEMRTLMDALSTQMGSMHTLY